MCKHYLKCENMIKCRIEQKTSVTIYWCTGCGTMSGDVLTTMWLENICVNIPLNLVLKKHFLSYFINLRNLSDELKKYFMLPTMQSI